MKPDILAAIDAAVGCQQCGGRLNESVSDDFCTQDCQADWHAGRSEPLTDYVEPWHRPWDFPGIGSDVAVFGRSRYAAGGFLRPPAQHAAVQIDRGNGWEDMGRLADGFTFTTRAVDPPPNPNPPAIVGTPTGSVRAFLLSAQITFGSVIHTWDTEFRLPRSTGDLSADLAAARRASARATTDAHHAAVALRMESLAERQAEVYRRMWDDITVSITVVIEQFAAGVQSMFDALNRAVSPPEPTVADADPAVANPFERALQLRRNRNTGPPARGRAPRTIGRTATARRD